MSKPDGTARLCELLYGEVKASKYLGGSEAKMLHDAADEIEKLRTHIEALKASLKIKMGQDELVFGHAKVYVCPNCMEPT